MKKHLLTAALLFSALFILNSCATSSITREQRKTDIEKSREPETNCFVQFNDGTVKNYKTLKLVTGMFKAPYLLADGKTKIHSKEIKAYQNKDHYAISQATFGEGRTSHVATETLPGFAIRTVKGKLNVYCKKYYNGQVAVDEYYLQVGNTGEIVAFSSNAFNELIKSIPEAYGLFNNKKFKGTLPEKLTAAAHMYNSGQMMTSN
jgi:hypothetical protein